MGTLRDQINVDKNISKSLPLPGSLGLSLMLDWNMTLVARYAKNILLAYLLVMQTFLQAASRAGDLVSFDIKKQWTLFQVHHSIVSRFDLVQETLQWVDQASEVDVQSKLAAVVADIQSICKEPLFLVLDESNVLTRTLDKAFQDSEGQYYSLLQQILKVWKSVLGNSFTFVVVGTDIPRETFRGEEWAGYRWTSDTGAFDSQALQSRYLKDITPPGYFDSPSGVVLRHRIWRWFRSRYDLSNVP
jgi:hypothetical protein